MGIIGSIIVGGLAGWLASMVMKTGNGILLNIILGIIGSAVAGFLFGLVGVNFSGILGYLVAGFVGAVILIWGYRKLS
jgi:uncharacterized membrane protein YeaQ/YmgE (transglycosylase-associated protein family)